MSEAPAADSPADQAPVDVTLGFIAGSTLAYQWNFYLFAVFALLGAALIAAVPRVTAAIEAPDGSAR